MEYFEIFSYTQKNQQYVWLNYVKILAKKMIGNNQISLKYKSSIMLQKKLVQCKSSFHYDLWYVNITWFMAANLACQRTRPWYYSKFKEWSVGSILVCFNRNFYSLNIFELFKNIKSITKSQLKIFNEKQQWKVCI